MVHITKEFKIRTWFALKLISLAAWIMGVESRTGPLFNHEKISAIIWQMVRLGAIDSHLSGKMSDKLHNYLTEKLNNPEKTFEEIVK